MNSEPLNKVKIPENEISTFGYNFDESGKVISWKDKILRGIYPDKQGKIKKLLNSGLIDELTAEGLFPKTTVTAYSLDGFDLILEHEKIEPVIYPGKWSFDMLKDAALCTLKVNIIARKYGYQTIDAHGFNILFKAGKPYFIDLGSFISSDENPKGWIAYDEFRRFFLYPLKVFKSGNLFLGRSIMNRGKNFMPHESYLQYKYPVLRAIKSSTIAKICNAYYKFREFTFYNEEEIIKRSPKKLVNLLVFLKRNKLAPLQKVNLKALENKVNKIKLPESQSQWGDYHNKLISNDSEISSTPRFNRIIEIIKELNPASVIEIAGNQGMFAQLILQETSIKSIICTDYDEIAVNKMYNRIKAANLNITPSILDIISPQAVDYGLDLTDRYRSELLTALALTHHLILTQKIPINKVFEQFNLFSSKYVITEFMPLGLYSSADNKTKPVPDWYHEDWFRENFENHYEILYREQLEINRILFVGKKRDLVCLIVGR